VVAAIKFYTQQRFFKQQRAKTAMITHAKYAAPTAGTVRQVSER